MSGEIHDISAQAFSKDIFGTISEPHMQQIYEMYDRVSASMREHLNAKRFQEHKAILLGPVTDPGIRGSKQVTVDYYGYEYKMMSSAILYKQLLAAASKKAGRSGNIYFFADNIRLEPIETAQTDRHLAEFIQVDIEVADTDHFGAMKVAEELFASVCRSMKKYEPELKEIWNFFEPHSTARGLKPRSELKIPTTPFKKYTHKEVIDMINKKLDSDPQLRARMGQLFKFAPKPLSYNSEIPWEYEWLLSSLHDEPFFIYDYPKGSRGFYDKEYKDRPGLLMDFDLVFPDGYGEAASGAAREFELERIIARMKETGEKLEKYKWYLEFLQKSGIQTAGFGIGLERTVRYICALPSIYLALPCPKVPGMYSP